MIDDKRLSKYLSKIEHINRRLDFLRKSLGEEEQEVDEKTFLAIMKAYQEVIDGIMDAIAMVCKDSGIPPTDDEENVKKLVDKMVFTVKDEDLLIKAENLRNEIIRNYDNLNRNEIIKRISEILEDIPDILKVIEGWLEKEKQSKS